MNIKIQKIKDIENPFVCSHCGSTRVQMKVWIDANTGQQIVTGKLPYLEEQWCANCGVNMPLISQEEFEQQKQHA